MKNSEHLKISVYSADSFCATFGLCRAVVWQMSKICGVSWKYVMYPKNMWCILKICGVSWKYVVYPENMWCILKYVVYPENMWCILKIYGVSWKYVMYPEICGVSWNMWCILKYVVYPENVWCILKYVVYLEICGVSWKTLTLTLWFFDKSFKTITIQSTWIISFFLRSLFLSALLLFIFCE